MSIEAADAFMAIFGFTRVPEEPPEPPEPRSAPLPQVRGQHEKKEISVSRPANKNTDLKANVLRILDEIKRRVEAPEHSESAEEWAEALDGMLDEMKNNDQFGSEASTDPRGDFRNGEWSMWEMEPEGN